MARRAPAFSPDSMCERIKQEFTMLKNDTYAARQSRDSALYERNELEAQSKSYHDAAYYLNIQLHKQCEINEKLLNILGKAAKLLPEEMQQTIEIEAKRARTVTLGDVERRILDHRLCTDPFPCDLVADFSSPDEAMPSEAPRRERERGGRRTSGRSQMDEDAFDVSAQGAVLSGDDDGSAIMEDVSSAAARSRGRQLPANPPQRGGSAGHVGTTSGNSSSTEEVVEQSQAQQIEEGQPISIQTSKEESDGGGVHQQEGAEPEPSSPTPPVQQQAPVKAEPRGDMEILQSFSSKPRQIVNANNFAFLSGRKDSLKSMRQVGTLQHNNSVSAVTFSSNGERLYTGEKGFVRVWDANLDRGRKQLAEMHCFNDHYIRSCKLTQDERQMVVCGEAKEIFVWDISRGSPESVHAMEAPGVDFHYALAMSSDSRFCCSCFSNGSVGMWDLASGKLVRTMFGHEDSVSCVDIFNDGRVAVTGSLDHTVRVWDLGTGAEIASFTFPAQVFTLGVCPNTSFVAVGLDNAQIEVIDLNSTLEAYQLGLHENCVLTLKYSADGQYFVSGGKDKLVNVWQSPFGPCSAQTKEMNSVLSCDVSPTRPVIATGSWEHSVALYELK